MTRNQLCFFLYCMEKYRTFDPWFHCQRFTSNQYIRKGFLFANVKSKLIFFWIQEPHSFSSLNMNGRIVKANSCPSIIIFHYMLQTVTRFINSDWSEQSEAVQFRVKLLEIAWNCALLEIEGLIFVLRVIKLDHLVFQPLLLCCSQFLDYLKFHWLKGETTFWLKEQGRKRL